MQRVRLDRGGLFVGLLRSASLTIKAKLGPGVNVASRDKAVLTLLFLRVGQDGPVLRTLDVGCGNGYFSRAALATGSAVVAITMLNHEHAKANRLFEHLGLDIDLRLCELDDLDEEAAPFDQVLMLDVLEHIRDDAAALRKVYSLMAEDGFLFLSFPNRDYAYGNDRHVARFERGWHVRHGYTFESIEGLLIASGFEPIDRRSYGTYGSHLGIRFQQRLGLWKSALFLPLMRLLKLILPARRRHTLLVIARKI